jgi:hypothetical protein
VNTGNIKGLALREFLAWHEQRFGRSPTQAAVRAAEERFPGHLEPAGANYGVLTSRWYPAPVAHAVLDSALAERSPAELQKLVVDAAEFILQEMLRGAYRTLIGMFVTPDRYAKHGEKLWQLQYDTGKPVFRELSRTSFHVTYEGWKSHHPFVCHLNMASARPLFTAMGCKEVEYRRLGCISEGAPACTTSIHWK